MVLSTAALFPSLALSTFRRLAVALVGLEFLARLRQRGWFATGARYRTHTHTPKPSVRRHASSDRKLLWCDAHKQSKSVVVVPWLARILGRPCPKIVRHPRRHLASHRHGNDTTEVLDALSRVCAIDRCRGREDARVKAGAQRKIECFEGTCASKDSVASRMVERSIRRVHVTRAFRRVSKGLD